MPDLAPPDVIINEIMDLEDDGQFAAARERLREAARCDADLPDRHAQTRRAAGLLRDRPDCPDFSVRVLANVDAQRPYLPRRASAGYDAGRLAVAACTALAVGALILLRPGAPDQPQGGQTAQTSTGEAGLFQADALRSVRTAGGWDVQAPQRSEPSPRRSLSIGSTRAYDLTDWDTSLRLTDASPLDTFMPAPVGYDHLARASAAEAPQLTLLGATTPSARTMPRPMRLDELAELWSAGGDRSRLMGGRLMPSTGDDASNSVNTIRFDEPWWDTILLRARSAAPSRQRD